MKTLKNITLTALITLLAASPALAARTAHIDNSGFIVWAFLGFCALIVVAQLVPAVMVITGIVKAIASPKAKEQTEQ